jgi:hypothetical protein
MRDGGDGSDGAEERHVKWKIKAVVAKRKIWRQATRRRENLGAQLERYGIILYGSMSSRLMSCRHHVSVWHIEN